MTRLTEAAVAECGHDAAEIAALANLMADALRTDPATDRAGEAASGLATLATRLSNQLLELADPNA